MTSKPIIVRFGAASIATKGAVGILLDSRGFAQDTGLSKD